MIQSHSLFFLVLLWRELHYIPALKVKGLLPGSSVAAIKHNSTRPWPVHTGEMAWYILVLRVRCFIFCCGASCFRLGRRLRGSMRVGNMRGVSGAAFVIANSLFLVRTSSFAIANPSFVIANSSFVIANSLCSS